MESTPRSTRSKVLTGAVRFVLWGAMLLVLGCSWLVNTMLKAAPQAFERVHQTECWTPWDCVETEVRDFMDSRYGGPNAGYIAPWPDRLMAGRSNYPGWNRHTSQITSMYLYRWTLEPKTRRELSFNETLSVSEVPRRLSLEEYLLAAHDKRIWKQGGLNNMLRRGDISPPRYRELTSLLEQAFPDATAYNW